jgi:hypothetical protein
MTLLALVIGLESTGLTLAANPKGEPVPDAFNVPVRAVVTAVNGPNLTVGPGSDNGMKEGMAFRIFRGSNPKGTTQWVGKAKAVKVDARTATLQVTEGTARITDLVISQPVQLAKEIVMPKADRTERPNPPALTAASVDVKLCANAENMGKETVSFGLPFPPRAIQDDSTIAVFLDGRELPVATKVLAPWRLDAKDGSPRSVLVQFPLDFTGRPEQTVTVRWDEPRTQKLDKITPVKDLLVFKTKDAMSKWEDKRKPVPVKLRYEEPRVLAVLPANWLCDSWVAGPEVPTADNTIFPAFDQFWTGKFPDQAKSTLSDDYAEQQLDRADVYYKVYVRTGDKAAALESYRIATYYRNGIYTAEQTKRGRGALSFKHSLDGANGTAWLDIKYAYCEGPAIHYLLTGDDRFVGTIEDICAFFNSDFGSFIRQDYSRRRFRGFTERFAAFAMLAKMHAYDIIGKPEYLADARQQVDHLYDMQNTPVDKQKPDGSWRHNSGDHGEGGDNWGSSIWMSTYLIDGLFQYWLLTGDARVPTMIVNYTEYTERYGLVWFEWADQGNRPGTRPRSPMCWYFASSLQGGELDSGSESDHNVEVGYLFMTGYYFRPDPRYLTYGALLMNYRPGRIHPRMYNWMYRASPQAMWMLKEAEVRSADIQKIIAGNAGK